MQGVLDKTEGYYMESFEQSPLLIHIIDKTGTLSKKSFCIIWQPFFFYFKANISVWLPGHFQSAPSWAFWSLFYIKNDFQESVIEKLQCVLCRTNFIQNSLQYTQLSLNGSGRFCLVRHFWKINGYQCGYLPTGISGGPWPDDRQPIQQVRGVTQI